MSNKNKIKNPEHMGPKEVFGVTALSTMTSIGAIFMSSMFMSFMTDYAGLGAWGATLATVLLLAARLIDAVDDPIQGFIMDNGKVGKYGKYKPFFMISIIMITVGVIALYALPRPLTSIPVAVGIWVIFFYFVYDIGTSFCNMNLMYRTMTNDANERAKLLVGPRIWTMVLSMIGAGMTAVAVSLYAVFGSYNTAFMVMATVFTLIGAVISVIGWFMVKERHVVQQEEGEKVKISDFFDLIKTNKPMMINFCKCIFTGFIWTFLFAAPSYYVKWAFCADLTTGQVDMGLFATYSLIISMMMMMPLLLGVVIAAPVLKLFKGDFVKMHKVDLLCQGLGGLIIFLGQVLGVLRSVPAIFFIAMFVIAMAIGIDFVPGSTISMEVMDYTIYSTGKDRSALTGVLEKFLEKAQTAVSSALVGVILIAVGYQVDSVTGDYAGSLESIPTMLNGLAFVIGLLPAILAVIGVLIIRKYPIDQDLRKKMHEYIDAHQATKE